ncbi:hypothetical protein DJ70_08065 [Halorubrum halodurans]|uniref:Uncharacterized protein n=1 Tax=Halorubrum halodurans TaxID=1383851 RepID=A0A256IJD1_9EURY|nr:hypothetical protein DJ70_08065 [Halorubrum halodurans]
MNKSWWTLRYGLFENSVGDNGDIVNHGEIPLRTLTIDGDTYQIDSDGSDDRDLDREASEIGLIGSNTARTPTLNALEDAGIDYEQTGTLTAKRGNRSQEASVYEYEKDGEMRWMVEWSERAGIDEARFCSLIFDREPGQTRLSHGVEIYDQRRTDRVQALFEQ